MVMLLLFPIIVKKKEFELEQYFSEIRAASYDVFQRNCVRTRKAFFGEPLMKYLWKIFIDFKPSVIINHLEKTRNNANEGELQHKVLIESMIEMEETCKIKILPLAAYSAKIGVPGVKENQIEISEPEKSEALDKQVLNWPPKKYTCS